MSAFFGPGGNSKEFYEQNYKSTKQAMKWVADYGLDAYEYQGGNGITGGEKSFREIGVLAQEHNIKLSLHAPYYISLASGDPLIQEKNYNHIIKSLDSASFMGAKIIVVHPGGQGKANRADALRQVEMSLNSVSDKLSGKYEGIHIGLETMGKIGQLGTLDEVITLCKSCGSRFVPVVDFGHLHAREHGELFKNAEDYQRIFDTIGEGLGREAAERLHCHFSKIEHTAGGEKKHLTFEDEVFGPAFEPLIEVIARLNLSPTIICESDGTMAADALSMKNYYRKLI